MKKKSDRLFVLSHRCQEFLFGQDHVFVRKGHQPALAEVAQAADRAFDRNPRQLGQVLAVDRPRDGVPVG